DSAADLADKVFGYIHREPASLVPAVQNMARMLLAGQTGRAVRVSTPTAAEAQRAEHRRPQAGRLVLDPANDISGRFGLGANHLLCVSHHTSKGQVKLAAKKRQKSRFHRTILPFATETSLVAFAREHKMCALLSRAGFA